MFDPFAELTDIVGRALEGPLKEEFSIPTLPQHRLISVLLPGSHYTDPLAAAILMTELVRRREESDRLQARKREESDRLQARKRQEIDQLLADLICCMDAMPYDYECNADYRDRNKDVPQESAVEPPLEESLT